MKKVEKIHPRGFLFHFRVITIVRDLKTLIHECEPSEIVGLLTEAENELPFEESWIYEHVLREGNRRYFEHFGTPYYADCDSGFRPINL